MAAPLPFAASAAGKKTFKMLLIVALSILGLSFFIPRAAVFDINLADTYYVLSKRTLYYAAGLFLVLCYLVYQLNSRSLLSKWLVFLHLFLTLVPIIYLLGRIGGFNSESPFITPPAEMKIFEKLIAAFVLGQLLLIGNLIFGLIKLTKAQKHSEAV
ncbi:hypothetical protein C7T94_13330 [Pedobacter yulinensis]|uniref:Uncharacterized protein n=1 Tax=Pedobacter yulinensis TaxID=2126353 RepID=A0A2T3HM65_9SPHI|nr:hypothetical protein [Pedobacter yulinensis]PST83530.1 hypothetical protein C7T94_13330 [Pedobacter yulinensis]